jgi:hypothetical protein
LISPTVRRVPQATVERDFSLDVAVRALARV